MSVVPSDVTWLITEEASRDVEDIRSELGDAAYFDDCKSLRDMLCCYFTSEVDCLRKQGKSIACVGATDDGGKILKVRWLRPGSGKSGGLRLAFVAYCDRRVVVLCRAFLRSDDPDDGDFEAAGELAGRYDDTG